MRALATALLAAALLACVLPCVLGAAPPARPSALARPKSWQEAWAALSPYGLPTVAAAACNSSRPTVAASCGVSPSGGCSWAHPLPNDQCKCCLLQTPLPTRCQCNAMARVPPLCTQEAAIQELWRQWKIKYKLNYATAVVSGHGESRSV